MILDVNKIITLGNKEKYLVISHITNNNKDYYIQIPYGVTAGNPFFKAAYNDLYSNKGIFGATSDEKFNTF